MFLDEVITAQKRGDTRGIMSLCSAHPWVIKAAMVGCSGPLLIEATCNQVNQYGGYTGMTPRDFAVYLTDLAEQTGFPAAQLILGGDHLGPNVWKNEPAVSAMEKSKALIKEFVQAGFTKIHLDTSMKLGDDPDGNPDVELIARRAATLAKCAEETAPDAMRLRYIIGTEVPRPGGALDPDEVGQVTTVESARQTLESTRMAFLKEKLGSAWERVSALVVNPGVEFGDDFVLPYEPRKAAALSQFIDNETMIYEAHSTDYQTQASLRSLVRDHFAILKVGPALTNAYREAIYWLAEVEQELIMINERSNIMAVLDAVMRERPEHWCEYYHGTEAQIAHKMITSLSDRIRYYWSDPRVQKAVTCLLTNLSGLDITSKLKLLNGTQAILMTKLRSEAISPEKLILANIHRVLDSYAEAVGEFPGDG
jgi:D-tagatose-1,6-bisphosphate aldolase subunit GatZ/KbaZ